MDEMKTKREKAWVDWGMTFDQIPLAGAAKVGFYAGYAAALSDDGWKQRCEQLEVVAEALYRGHKDGRELFNTYRSVYLSTSDDDTTWKPTEDDPFPY